MNTLLKLSDALSKRKLSFHLYTPKLHTWVVQLASDDRSLAASGQGQTVDAALSMALKRWDAKQGIGSVAPSEFTPPAPSVEHGALPGHEHCGQPHCAFCQARYDKTADDGRWLSCVNLTCPKCRAAEEEAATGVKHDKEWFLAQDYPVTIYEGPDGGFVASCKDLPDCTVDGETLKDAYDEAKDECEAWIETAFAMGDPIPPPSPAPRE
jgi:predicted RNase H-like HicB family nuclease